MSEADIALVTTSDYGPGDDFPRYFYYPGSDGPPDSGGREEFPTGSVRDTRAGKGRYDLLPSYALARLALHFEEGAAKYGDNNWRRGQPLSRYLDSALRHIFGYKEGMRSEDHLAAALWNIAALIWTEHEVDEGRLPNELADYATFTG